MGLKCIWKRIILQRNLRTYSDVILTHTDLHFIQFMAFTTNASAAPTSKYGGRLSTSSTLSLLPLLSLAKFSASMAASPHPFTPWMRSAASSDQLMYLTTACSTICSGLTPRTLPLIGKTTNVVCPTALGSRSSTNSSRGMIST